MEEKAIIEIIEKQSNYFKEQHTYKYEFRIEALQNLKAVIKKYEKDISNALKEDLGKHEFEVYSSELGIVYSDINHTIKHLKKWMKPKKIKTPIYLQPSSSRILYSPLGVNLIIVPFNYPINLTFIPLIAAISAGNTAIIKTSRATPNSSKVIQSIIKECFKEEHVAFIPNDNPDTNNILLKQKFDHIFFTGSTQVGSIVMSAAAKYLTPVTLELGGKSPCIVHSDAKLDVAVRRIISGKFINVGQTCIAPDYLLVHKDIEEDFINKIKERIISLYGKNPHTSPDYGRIINNKEYNRIIKLIDPKKVVIGGDSIESEKYIAPTIMKGVSIADPVMQEEIFGPVLPIISYNTISDVRKIVSALPKHPLSLYVFSESKSVSEKIVSEFQFGGGCINQCVRHTANPNLPFGGVGFSGVGSYHGIYGFERFSHKKSVLKSATWLDPAIIYPPYEGKIKMLRKLLK